jgi:energy-coupling factor transporter ATP-binding protein EcfA2
MSGLSTAKLSELAQYLNPGRSVEVDGRSITAEETAGPPIIEVTDQDGTRTCSDPRQVPDWAVRDLIEHFVDDVDPSGDDFDDAYSWLEALMSAARKFGTYSSFHGEREVKVSSTVGPSIFVVNDGRTKQSYANLDDAPDIDQFRPALLANAEREIEFRRRSERHDRVQKRLDEMFKSSEKLDAPPAFTKVFEPAAHDGTPYVFSAELVLAINVALTTGRPLLVQGPPGSGKSSIAAAVARVLGWPYYEGEFAVDPAEPGVVLLVDDIDQVTADYAESLVRAWHSDSPTPRLLVLTATGERAVPPAVRGRCVEVTLPVPDEQQLMSIAAAHGLTDDPELAKAVAGQLVRQPGRPVSVSNFLDGLRTVRALELDPSTPEWQIALQPLPDFEEKAADPAPASRHCRVFLCHSSGDKPAVRELYGRLHQEGFDAWLDEENILPGQDWDMEIRKAVQRADLVIVCLSTGSVGKKGYVQREIKMVLDLADEQPEGKIFLIPAKLEECEVPLRLARWQWVDLFESKGYNRLLSALWIAAEDLNLAATAAG